MTKDEIIEMAKQAGLIDVNYEVGQWDVHEVTNFAKLVAQHEREALYSIVMEAPFRNMEQDEFDSEIGTAMKAMAFDITAAIRARGQA